ncbi:MAG: outer membrane beta-barrel family protein [Bacteroidota bacterium]
MKKFTLAMTISLHLLFVCQEGKAQDASVEVRGEVLASSNQQALEFATVLLVDPGTETALAGTSTSKNGAFVLTSPKSEFYIKISFIGFAEQTLTDFAVEGNKLDLGQIFLKENMANLEEVEIRAEKSQMEFKLDKRVFNVGQDLSSAGGSALEVLDNVPSVNVSIEGNISLRGNPNVQILINGNPSVMTNGDGSALGTITAEMIESVEVITNPSAKYDAEGTSGILNIILKKEEKKGINGGVTLNTGSPNNHSLGLSLNRRTEKFNLFSQFGAGYRTFESKYEGFTLLRSSSDQRRFDNAGEADKNEEFYHILLGADYHINRFNVLTLSGNFGYEIEDEFSTTNYFLSNSLSDALGSSVRREVTEAINPKWQYELQYEKTFADNKERALRLSAIGSFFGKDQSSDFENRGTWIDLQQSARTDFSQAVYTFQGDYSHPFSERNTLETGVRYQIYDITNDFGVIDQIDGVEISNPDFTNIFDTDQKVLGAYATYAYEWKKWGIKGGLRVENTDLRTLLRVEDIGSQQNYTNLFPSLHISNKFSESLSAQLGYSRRISRPNMWDLNPFTNIRDNLNLSTGNPDLQPEFTDSYELTAIKTWEKASVNFSIFHQYSTDVVRDIVRIIDSLTLTRPENVGIENNTGIEVNGKAEPFSWLSILGDFNGMFFDRNGTFENQEFDFENTRWSGRLTTKYRLPKDLDMEIASNYQSSEQTVQGKRGETAWMDFGIKKKFLKGRAVINISIRDVFASRKFIWRADQAEFLRFSESQWGIRRIVLGFSYGFGKGEAMEYSGHKTF